MKKILIVIPILFLINFISIKVNAVPDDAIRIRVVGASNNEYDQNIKEKVAVYLQYEMFNLLKNVKTSDDARIIIETNLNKIDNGIYKILKKENYSENYKINYGLNYFPKKIYKGIEYEEGEYESLLVTLGSGEGNNWWCILFPPFCLIEAEENKNVEYKFFLQEIIEKIFIK